MSEWQFISALNDFCSIESLDILHFACHAEPNLANPLSSWLEIGPGRLYQIAFMDQTPVVRIGAPLVILNACATGIRRPKDTYDFVKALWRHGAKNIVAVEAAVESSVAARYASELYRDL